MEGSEEVSVSVPDWEQYCIDPLVAGGLEKEDCLSLSLFQILFHQAFATVNGRDEKTVSCLASQNSLRSPVLPSCGFSKEADF